MSHSFIQNCCCITASFTASRMNSWTLSLHWSCLCSRCYHPLMSDQLQAARQCPPINAFAARPLGLKLSWPKTKLQNVGAGDPPSTILIDGVPVEGVEEFIYLGSKKSSNGYCRPDILRRIGLACSAMNSLQRVWNCSSLSISTNVQMYQALICLFWSKVQKHRPSWSPTWIHWRLSTRGISDRYCVCWWAHVSNAEVLQRSRLSTIGDILHWRVSLFGHVAHLDPEVSAHDALCLTVDTYEGRKLMASWRRPLGRPRNVWFNKIQQDSNTLLLSTLWRTEIARGHGAEQQFTRTTRRRRRRWWRLRM